MNALIQDSNRTNLNPNPAQTAESTLRQNLTEELKDKDYRYGYAESFLNTKLASQVKTIRIQRSMTQAQVAELMGIRQPGYARFEDVNHSVWKTDTLWDIARALDVRVNISFETFGSLITEKEHFDKEHLERPAFNDDPVFRDADRGPSHATSLGYGVFGGVPADLLPDLMTPSFYPDLVVHSPWDWATDIFGPGPGNQEGSSDINPLRVSHDEIDKKPVSPSTDIARQYQKAA